MVEVVWSKYNLIKLDMFCEIKLKDNIVTLKLRTQLLFKWVSYSSYEDNEENSMEAKICRNQPGHSPVKHLVRISENVCIAK